MIGPHCTAVRDQGTTRKTPASQSAPNYCGHGRFPLELTGESRIDPTRLIFILKMNKFPICFMISLLGNPILPVSDRLLGISFVCSIVLLMSSSKREILTD